MKNITISLLVFLCASAFIAPDAVDPISQLRETIDTFNKKYHRNKLDLFFNQSKYSPGDTVLVRTLYLTADQFKPVEGGQIIYIELFDQKGARVMRNQILAVNGIASNALMIPENLSPGIYLLVAYSDWMRNLDPSLFYKQEFFITGKELLTELKPSITTVGMNFYPEGGSLVGGIDNNVVLEVPGNLQNAKAIIKDGSSVITTVSFDRQGLAQLNIKPLQGAHYTADLWVDNQVKTFDFPPAVLDGISMVAKTTAGTDEIHIVIKPSGDLDQTRKYFLVIASSKGIGYTRQLEFKDKESIDMILPVELPYGINQVMVVDDNLKFWIKRVVMIDHKPDYTIKLTKNKNVYSTREPVKIEVEVIDKFGNPAKGIFSMRVTNQDIFKDTVNTSSLYNNLVLYDDISATRALKGSPDQETINRYLVTQSCPWLDWDKMIKVNALKPAFSVQRNIAISGRAISLETGQPVPDSTQIMFFLRRQVFGYEITTTSNGTFNCPILFDFNGTDEVFYAASYRGRDLNNISLKLDKQDTVYGFKARPWSQLTANDQYGLYDFQKKIVDKSFSFFSRNKVKKDSLADPNAFIEDELQGADMVLRVNDFILFPTMTDLIREVLRSVDYRKIRGKDVIRVYTTHKRPTNFAGPLYVIDGVLTKNPATFLNLKPSEIITIKLVKDGSKLAKFGTLGTNGVILVRTKNSDRKAGIVEDNTFPLVGMSPQYNIASNKEVISPSRNLTTPFLRPCLFWVPNQTLDLNGKASIQFTTSDDEGNFKVHIEGLTTAGNPFVADETFQVKYDQPK